MKGSSVKIKNRRINVINHEDKGYLIEFITACSKEQINEKRSYHEVLKGRAVITTIKLTQEGLYALYKVIQSELFV